MADTSALFAVFMHTLIRCGGFLHRDVIRGDIRDRWVVSDSPERWHPPSLKWENEPHLGPRWRWLSAEMAAETNDRRAEKFYIHSSQGCNFLCWQRGYSRRNKWHRQYNPEVGERQVFISSLWQQWLRHMHVHHVFGHVRVQLIRM